jgi:pimeloyl-ACP methyl ester carboxylesterase
MSRAALLVACFSVFCYCFPYQRQIDANRAAVEGQFPDSYHTVTHAGRTMHYVRTGLGKHLVVFVHGSPGSWDAFAEFMIDPDLIRSATLISVDRLGFGKSEPGQAEKSLGPQSILIARIIETEMKRLGGDKSDSRRSLFRRADHRAYCRGAAEAAVRTGVCSCSR